jgi:hypothetical protein
MMEQDPLSITLAEATRDAQAILGRHLSPEHITACVEGSLDPAIGPATYSHLAGCADCAELVRLSAEGMARVMAMSVASPPLRAATGWVRAAMLAGGLGIAAGWLAAVLWFDPSGFDARLGDTEVRIAELQAGAATLEQRVREASSPRVNVRAVDLFPDSFTRRSAGGESAVVVAAAGGDILLVLNSQQPEGTEPIRAVLADEKGQVAWESDALERLGHGEFTLQFPARFLAPGTFELRLHRPGSAPPVETYRFRLQR